MKKFFIYYFYFAGILFTLNDERFLGISSKFFWESCRHNPTNLYIFLISTALILLAIILIPRFKSPGNELQVPFNQIQNLEINIIGLVPYYQIRFYYDIIGNKIFAFFRAGLHKKRIWEKQSRIVIFFWQSIGTLVFILFIPLALLLIGLFAFLSCAPLLSLMVIISITSPQFFDFIIFSLKKPIFENVFIFIFLIGSLPITVRYVILNRDYSRSRKVLYTLDVENKILRSVLDSMEDIPLHTLSSFRRHPIYPTGIILNNGNLLESPAIDWRITTNQGIGTTNELLTFLNNLISEAKIQNEIAMTFIELHREEIEKVVKATIAIKLMPENIKEAVNSAWKDALKNNPRIAEILSPEPKVQEPNNIELSKKSLEVFYNKLIELNFPSFQPDVLTIINKMSQKGIDSITNDEFEVISEYADFLKKTFTFGSLE